ncbi:hypothetical protein [Ekhidna sp.]|uniref:hypothetical protein n=1 Tax=Ekhidna sp. TaxID=2608089 RepID=UPI003CCC3D21
MSQNIIKHVRTDKQISGSALDGSTKSLFLELRDERTQSVSISKLDLESMRLDKKETKLEWWSKLVGAKENCLFCVAYLDQKDPTNHVFFTIELSSNQKKKLDQLPELEVMGAVPEIYEHGSEYYKTVAEFLALDLPLSCEYMEWNDKIIISYYLRSGNGFARYLLLIKGGEKQWKIVQDEQMKGFSPGSFFVFEDKLIFIKDGNEVCVYTD